MKFRDEEKLQKDIKRSKFTLILIGIVVIIVEVLRWFFDK
jgi:hypothetical protein